MKKVVYYILKTKFPTENTNIEGVKVPETIAFIIFIKNRNLEMNILKYLSKKKKDFIFHVCGPGAIVCHSFSPNTVMILI